MTAPSPPALDIHRFRELWIHTGTACNLACPFCHEGSKPGDARIAPPNLAQLAPVLDAAAARGVERFAFTGGEPLILKGILEILRYALQLRPALVLTNGTAPFIRRTHQLAQLRAAPHALSFRVSIDHPDEARHDAGRGLKNFRKALEGLRLLHAAGFEVGITRQISPGEDPVAVAARFRQLLRKQRLPEELSIIALPDLGALGTPPPPQSGAACASSFLAAPAVEPACTRGRMLRMRGDGLRLHACPLTDDDERFDTGTALEAALTASIDAVHPRCALCLGPGVDYAGSHVTA